MKNTTFRVSVQPDGELIDRCAELSEVISADDKLKLSKFKIQCRYDFGGDFEIIPSKAEESDELAEIQRHDNHILSRVSLNHNGDQLLRIDRDDDLITDKVRVNLKKFDKKLDAQTAVRLLQMARSHLGAVEEEGLLADELNEEVRDLYGRRELELRRLEELSTQVLDRITEKSADLREQLDDEYKQRREELEEDYQTRKATLEERIEQKQQELDDRKKVIKDRLEEVEDREARFMRRKIRKDLKKKFEERSKEFSLTEGTNKLRTPIHLAFWLLLVVLGGLFIILSMEGALEIGSIESLSGLQFAFWGGRPLLIGAAFGAVGVFYLRWQNRWLRRHADEEFRLKRMELDVDRASWVVELAMEWENEKGEKIPDELVHRLTTELFEHEEESGEASTAADQLASALLGSASELKLDVNGQQLSFDRKGVKNLKKNDTAN